MKFVRTISLVLTLCLLLGTVSVLPARAARDFPDPEDWDSDIFTAFANPEDHGNYYRQSYYTDIESLSTLQELLQEYVLDLEMFWAGSYKGDKEGYFWLEDSRHDYDEFSYEPDRVDIEIEDCHLIVGYRLLAKDCWEVFCLYSKDLADHKASEVTVMEKKSDKKGTGKKASSTESGQLPDLQAFSGNRLKDVSVKLGSTYTKATYNSKGGVKFVQEYIALLESEYGLTLRTSKEKRNSIVYCFDYSSSGISSFDCSINAMDVENSEDIELMIYSMLDGKEVQIWYADGFDYTDTGDRTELKFSAYGGGSSSNSSSCKGVPCSSCNNGRCRTCDGDGYVDDSDGLGVSACGNCNAGSCRSCDGTGYR